jgi:hypothetical protein
MKIDTMTLLGGNCGFPGGLLENEEGLDDLVYPKKTSLSLSSI